MKKAPDTPELQPKKLWLNFNISLPQSEIIYSPPATMLTNFNTAAKIVLNIEKDLG